MPCVDTGADTAATGPDDDGDGFVAASAGGADCDDDYAHAYPGAPELCDGRFNDCDAREDWSLTDERGAASFVDGDGVWAALDAAEASTSTAPGAIEIAQTGTAYFCSGEYWVRIAVEAPDVAIEAQKIDGQEIVLYGEDEDGEADRVVAVGEGAGVGAFSIRGLTLSGGEAAGGAHGGALAAGLGSSFEGSIALDGVTLSDNSATGRGGALYVRGGSLSLTDVFIGQNAADAEGGGLATEDVALVVLGGTIQINDASDGGGVWMEGGSLSVGLSDADEPIPQIAQNVASGAGGGLALSGVSPAILEDADVHSNTASGG